MEPPSRPEWHSFETLDIDNTEVPVCGEQEQSVLHNRLTEALAAARLDSHKAGVEAVSEKIGCRRDHAGCEAQHEISLSGRLSRLSGRWLMRSGQISICQRKSGGGLGRRMAHRGARRRRDRGYASVVVDVQPSAANGSPHRSR